MMARIKGKNTGPELMVRRTAHAMGYRFRLHQRKLPGSPDLVFPRLKLALFVHGCFWHGHDCRFFRLPATRREFWHSKIECNRANDRKAVDALLGSGWRVYVVWECAVRGAGKDIEGVVRRLGAWLRCDSEGFAEERE